MSHPCLQSNSGLGGSDGWLVACVCGQLACGLTSARWRLHYLGALPDGAPRDCINPAAMHIALLLSTALRSCVSDVLPEPARITPTSQKNETTLTPLLTCSK